MGAWLTLQLILTSKSYLRTVTGSLFAAGFLKKPIQQHCKLDGAEWYNEKEGPPCCCSQENELVDPLHIIWLPLTGHGNNFNHICPLLPWKCGALDVPLCVFWRGLKCSEQCDFFKTISEELNSSFTLSGFSVIIGGDFNVIFDQDLDRSGGLKKTKDSVKVLEDICLEHDLLDIWRVRHPKEKRFTWRQKTPVIQRCLDLWLISNGLQDDVVSVDIKPSIESDHSAITLLINGVDDSERGPSFWKFNSSLVNDSDYRFLLENIKNWLEEFKEIVDRRVLWDLLKCKIRQLTIKYSKEKAHSRKAKVKDLEEKLQNCTKNCENDLSKENLEELECLQAEYDDLYDYITQGAIIRSRANWYEKGEKKNKYFLTLEKSNKKKAVYGKLLQVTEQLQLILKQL